MNPSHLAVEGEAYPLYSKRLKLKHFQQLASALGLPKAATKSDIEVMITGKLTEMYHDPRSVQVVVSHTEQGEQLSMKDKDGTFLVTPPLTVRQRSPTPTFSKEEEELDLTPEIAQLHTVLQNLEEEKEGLFLELRSTRAEVDRLEAELKSANDRVVELWEGNCEQLLRYDSILAQKEEELQQLTELLQSRELELARLKATSLEAAIPGHHRGSSPLTSTSWLQGQQHCRSHETTTTTTTHVTTTTPNLNLLGVSDSTTTTTWITTTRPNLYSTGDSALATAGAQTKIGVSGNNLQFQSMPMTRPLMTSTELHPAGYDTGERESRLLSQQVTQLSTSLSNVVSLNRPVYSTGTASGVDLPCTSHASTSRRGKAPPVDPYTAEDVKTTFDDWLLTLERAATWNRWSPEESLMQLAGYLRGRAAQEWKLLLPAEKSTYQAATKALKERLDPGNQTLAALDFRHSSQQPNESVSDFIRRLENIFQTGFGHERISNETREMLLYGQLHEGLLLTLMESPAVSGAQSYKELCVAAKREERRLAELKKKQQYLKPSEIGRQKTNSLPNQQYWSRHNKRNFNTNQGKGNKLDKEASQKKQQRCYICDSPTHLSYQCKQRKTESSSKSTSQKGSKPPDNTNMMIQTNPKPLIEKCGSRCVNVRIEGVPTTGVIDTVQSLEETCFITLLRRLI